MRQHQLFILIIFLAIAGCGSGENPQRTSGENTSSTDLSLAGPELFAKYACATCHSLDGSEMYGPTLGGLYGKEVTVLRDGIVLKLEADAKYLKKAIADPAYEKVQGYETREMPVPIMPKEDLKLLVDYLKTLPEL